MKKLFVSCPMNGRNKNNIEQSIKTMHKEAENIFGEKLLLIQTYIEDDAPHDVNPGLWYLSKSIEKMSEADYFIGCSNLEFSGCELENQAAIAYGIPHKFINCRDFICFADIK